MSSSSLTLRLLCSEGRVNSENVKRGFISKEDWPKLIAATSRLATASIFIDENTDVSALQIRAKVRRLLVEQKSLGLIIVDYLQLMKGHKKYERRDQEISDISRALKSLAKEMNVPVIALSQLNRGLESRDEKRPNLSDLRESGAIEQDADLILFLYREEVYKKNNVSLKGKAELIVAKHRNGRTGTVNLTFLSDCTRFVDAASHEWEPD